ncbi:MAG: shikimate dehydrogenase [Pseudomonadota bacterium]
MPIDARTKVYAIIGSPVEHSLSPAMHNAAFRAEGLNAVYVALAVTELGAAIAGMRALGLAGLSVTVPHKTAVMKYLDHIDESARQVGAVNTVVWEKGALVGYNTDVSGALRSLEPHTDITGRRFLVIGAGGAARAIGYGLWQRGAEVTIANRSVERGRLLAEDLACAFVPLSEVTKLSVDGVIQATTVGMSPGPDRSPVPPQLFRPGMLVMDIVYKPRETRFLKDAKDRGCVCIGGLDMLLEQAVEQFRLWTGRAPRQVMAEALREGLRGHGD